MVDSYFQEKKMHIIFLGAANPETGRMIKAVEKSKPNFKVIGFIDNDPLKKETNFLGYPVFGGFECLDQFNKDEIYFVNLITGSTKVRYETSKYMVIKGCRFSNFIHPSVDLTMVRIGVGNYIQEGVIIQAEADIGNNCSFHIGALIAHEVKIGHSVFVAHAASISGCVSIGDGAYIGTNATILPRLKIGKWSTIGAGAVITKNVPDYATVVGNPGEIIRTNAPVYLNGNIISTEISYLEEFGRN
jgi:sugar O-acyltransferase (sialic acid O-acetyltransferase NeuD family)